MCNPLFGALAPLRGDGGHSLRLMSLRQPCRTKVDLLAQAIEAQALKSTAPGSILAAPDPGLYRELSWARQGGPGRGQHGRDLKGMANQDSLAKPGSGWSEERAEREAWLGRAEEPRLRSFARG